MADYIVEIAGTSDLASINRQIAGEEAGASEFKKSEVALFRGVMTNLATFSELAPGTVLPVPTLIKQGDPKPAGKGVVWSGSMIVSGSAQAVELYRA
jgi:hypothetical protein